MTFIYPPLLRIYPRSAGASLLLTAVLSALVGIADVLLATTIAGDYGLTLFLATPCALGIAAPLLHGIGAPRSFLQCLSAAIFSQLALFLGMALFAIEGIICIAMAAPLWLTIAVLGACIAYPIHRLMWKNRIVTRGFPIVALLLLGLIPALTGAEHAAKLEPPTLTLTTSIDIDASPEIVWQNLIQFPEIPPQKNLLTRMGLAYPLRAELHGAGLGATRFCIFSTGVAPETVTLWNYPTLLEFDVHFTPPPMREWSPYPHLRPPHLEGYLTSEHARFTLTALSNGQTRLTGTSWYKNRIFPTPYWRLWSDPIIHQIHLTVLTHIKSLSERPTRLPSGSTN